MYFSNALGYLTKESKKTFSWSSPTQLRTHMHTHVHLRHNHANPTADTMYNFQINNRNTISSSLPAEVVMMSNRQKNTIFENMSCLDKSYMEGKLSCIRKKNAWNYYWMMTSEIGKDHIYLTTWSKDDSLS